MSSAETIIRRIVETTQGETPATGTMDVLAGSGFSVSHQIGRADSQDVQADLQPRPTAETTFAASTSVNTDARFGPGRGSGFVGAHQEMFEEAMGAAAIAGYDSGEVGTISAEAAGNKLVNSDGWGSLLAGSEVLVTGMPANAATTPAADGVFRVHVVSVSGNDAFVAERTLVDEAPVSGVRVRNSRIFRIGTSEANRTATYEVWNSRHNRGRIWRGVGLTGYELSLPYTSGASETFNVICPQPGQAITTGGRLGLLDNAYGAVPPQIVTRRHLFGSLFPGSGFGLYLDGTAVPTVEFQSLSLSLSRPMATRGHIGDLFKQRVETDGLFEITVQMDFLQLDDSGYDDLRAAVDSRATVNLGFGLRTDEEHHRFYRIPALQLGNQTDPGRGQSGPTQHQLTGTAVFDPTHSMFQVTEIDAA